MAVNMTQRVLKNCVIAAYITQPTLGGYLIYSGLEDLCVNDDR